MALGAHKVSLEKQHSECVDTKRRFVDTKELHESDDVVLARGNGFPEFPASDGPATHTQQVCSGSRHQPKVFPSATQCVAE